VRRAGPCGVRAPGDQIYWDESKESFTDFLALNRAARARALGQGMPLAESSSRLATSWARLGHACARLGPQQLRVGGSKRKAPSRSLPLPSGSFHLPQWDFVACWADSAFPKGDSARHRGDSDPPGATRGADSAHAGPTRSAEWEHGRNKCSGSRIRRVSDRRSVREQRRSIQPLNACPPEGPEALLACSLFQGSKAWLEPRLEPAETHPGAPVVEKRRSGLNKHCFAERFRRTRFDEQG
jgi:hypothetical protein